MRPRLSLEGMAAEHATPLVARWRGLRVGVLPSLFARARATGTLLSLVPMRVRAALQFSLGFHRDFTESVPTVFLREMSTSGKTWNRRRLAQLLVSRSGIPSLKLDGMTDPGSINEVFVTRVYDVDGFVPNASTLVLDVGSKTGEYAILSSALRGARVLAFEPIVSNCEVILRNLELNPGCRVTLFPLALSDRNGTLRGRLYDTMLVSPTRGAPLRGISVLSAKLDDLGLLEGPLPREVLLKIDVEGYELAVLRGARKFISSLRPKIIVETNLGAMLDEVVTFLKGVGYKIIFERDEPGTAVLFAEPPRITDPRGEAGPTSGSTESIRLSPNSDEPVEPP